MGGEPTADLITEVLQAERDTRRALEQRALSLFASAGVIGGLSGIASRGSELSLIASILFTLALVALATGAVIGLLVAMPVLVPEVLETAGLRGGISDKEWDRGPDAHLRRAAETRYR